MKKKKQTIKMHEKIPSMQSEKAKMTFHINPLTTGNS